MADVTAQRDANTVREMSAAFLAAYQTSTSNEDTLTGKDAVSDVLASSLSAQKDFYSVLWSQMTDFFEPSVRYLGEQHALGQVSLDSPPTIGMD